MKYRVRIATTVLCVCLYTAGAGAIEVPPTAQQRAAPVPELVLTEEVAVVTSAPRVPPAITRQHAAKVRLDIEIREHTKQLADGVTYTYWTFGDDAPGQFIRVREGDLIEATLKNHPDNTVAHNIDFHAATGPGGGGEASFVAPGHSATFTWRAMAPGLYLYHCVAAPAGLHLANGMYGLLLVEPKEGLPKVDKEFFLVQGEFYTDAPFGTKGHRAFSMEKALREEPDYVVFNGHVGALMGEGALRVKAGESVRLYLGNAGPSLLSSFHVVGEIFDKVYAEGGSQVSQNNVQTTVVPVGGAAMVEFVAEVPGSYQLVDHSMFRAFNKGAMGTLEVEGAPRPQVFSGPVNLRVYDPGTRLARGPDELAVAATTQAKPIKTKQTPPGSEHMLEEGRQIFASVCAACHQADAQGMPGIIPPLANSDYLMADPERAIRVLLQGLSGPITVNGRHYQGVMPKLPLTDAQIAAVLSFVRTNFGNNGAAIDVQEIGRVRAALDTASQSVQVAADQH
jgi:nitrite reductase (NO-forming)